MTKNIMKKSFLIFFVTLFLFIIIGTLDESHSKAFDYQLSSSWNGYDLDFTPQATIDFDSDYRYFSEIIDSPASVLTDKIYVIENAYDLYMLSELTMGSSKILYLSLDYLLGNDIDYYQIVQQNIEQRFKPIGFIEPFTGTFDGQGFEITNLYFDSIMTEEYYQETYFGLRFLSMFSRVSSTGIIRNLGLINPIIIQPIEWGIMSYVSALVGENYGTIENVYLIDHRGDVSGFNAEGAFHLSGLVSINYGQFSNSFVSSEHIKSNAVVDNKSTSAVLYANLGTTSNIYYDQTLYADVNASVVHSTGLTTVQFQQNTIFDQGWFFNDHYHGLAESEAQIPQLTLLNTYPILKGLSIQNGNLEIDDARDMTYMNDLFTVSGVFRSSDYLITRDIDMSKIAENAYIAASIGFNGKLSSALSSFESRLYVRSSEQGGDQLYHTVLNLTISKPTATGNFASYALFSSFFGTIENLNFSNLNIDADNLSDHVSKTKILIGSLAGQCNSGTIENVHMDAQILIHQSTETTKLYVGGVVGEGNVSIERVSTNGAIVFETQVYHSNNNESSTGGIVGYVTNAEMNQVFSAIDITGISYTSVTNTISYLGGIIGSGSVDSLTKIVQDGQLISHDSSGYIETLYLGGIIGLETNQIGTIRQLYHDGNIDVILTNPMTLYLAGIMTIDGSNASTDASFSLYSLTNHGILSISPSIFYTPTELDLANMNIYVSGAVITKNVISDFYGLFNESNMAFDLSLIDELAGTLIALENTQTSVVHSSNTGDFDLTTEHVFTQDEIKVSGNILGQNISMETLRNEGDISVIFNHNTSVSSGNLYLVGLFEEVSQDMTARYGFNGGTISATMVGATQINYNLYISGVGYAHKNTNYYAENNINHQSIESITTLFGSIDHMLNQGDLFVYGAYHGNTRISGILMMNSGLMTSCINLGDIQNLNQTQVLNLSVESAGLVYLMDGAHAQIIDGANYGDIEATSTTINGFAHASGIALRNDIQSDGTALDSLALNQYAKIMFSINYGDIYAYSGIDESSGYTIASETRSKSAGIFALGLLTVVNTINYGNVFSRYLAGGIIGFIDFPVFFNYASGQVYLANSINYGKIRRIDAYDGTYSINMTSSPTRTVYNAFASTIAKFHTGTPTWEFLSMSSSDLYPIDYISFGYMLNFDSLSNMVGNAPEITLEASIATNGIGNIELMSIVDKFMTTNPNDDSKAPFNLFFIEVSPKGSFYGKHISSFSMTEDPGGIFHIDFIFRNLPVSHSGTNQYLRNFYSYVTRDKANDVLISKLEENQVESYAGIYVLSSSHGINNGIFIPDHFELENLSPQILGETPNLNWLGMIEDTNSILYKMTSGMRQIQASYATSIYDLEIQQVDSEGQIIENGLTLNKPIIDEERGLITYYLPSNATILNSTSSQSLSTYSYVEAAEGLGRKVPNIYENGAWTFKWVGQYKKSGTSYLEIGPYHSAGNYTVTFRTSVSNDKAAQNSDIIPNAVYTIQDLTGLGATINSIHTHLPHVKQVINNNYWWEQTGLYTNSSTLVAAGYGAYKRINYQQPPIYSIVYQYAGPSEELVTYERTSSSMTTVFNDAGIYFDVNLDSNTYTIAQGAALIYNQTAMHEQASVPQSFGVYDVLINALDDTYIDSVTDHYGSVRVFSENYNELIPATYRDYDIRIIRTADQSLSTIESLEVNQQNALPSYTDFRSIESLLDLHYESDGVLGTMNVSYTTMNIANQTNVLPWVRIYDDYTGALIDESLYVLSKGSVSNLNSFNNIDGTFGSGTVMITLEVTDLMPSGAYRFELKLLTDEVAKIYVNKIESSNASIVTITHNQQDIPLISGKYESYIPYGIYYDALDLDTNIVDFTNLDLIQNLYFLNLDENSIPSYLDDLVISPFATLVSVHVEFLMKDAFRHLYQIEYVIKAEDGTIQSTFHDLIEYDISPTPLNLYYNGGELNPLASFIEVSYLDAPTIRIEFELHHFYSAFGNNLQMTSSFTPDILLEEAVEGIDYFIHQISSIGFEIDFNQAISIGTYTFDSSYESTIILWGQTLTWLYDFEQIVIKKVKNDNSHLKNIMFVSDTIYSGFNTIVDDNEIDDVEYLNYLLYPNQRPMTVLPTTGIYYGNYASLNEYWVIGQVQKTNLSYYLPTFDLPDGAIIRRVIDDINLEPEYQSEILMIDFSPFGDTFNYILYRVYAHDFDMNASHYTDYHVAVQDMTNNIRFNLEVKNESSLKIEDLFVRINVCQLGESYQGDCSYEDTILSMTSHAVYNPYLGEFENNQFQTTVYGTYQLVVEVPKNITYTITLQNVPMVGSAFYLENSLLPRKYYVIVTLSDVVEDQLWGQKIQSINLGDQYLIDEMRTYVSGEIFLFENVAYQVQTGYSYTYNLFNLPGTSSAQGLMDMSHNYSSYSTYLVGDIVYDQGAYYESILFNDLGIAPDAAGILLGYWILIE